MTALGQLLVMVPSRGRPENIRRLVENWPTDVDLLVAVDDDDPKLSEYQDIPNGIRYLVTGPRLRLGPTLNAICGAPAILYKYVGFMGDDHLPRTPDWHVRVIEELERLQAGFVYGNDLLQGERLPTAVFMTSNIIQTLGKMVPKELVHMYLDDAWLAWGKGMNSITYLPDVVIEHIHPVANKTQRDIGYDEADSFMNQDRENWQKYISTGQLEEDIVRLERLKNGMATVS